MQTQQCQSDVAAAPRRLWRDPLTIGLLHTVGPALAGVVLGALVVAAGMAGGPEHWSGWALTLLSAGIVGACVSTDLREHRIPNAVTGPGSVALLATIAIAAATSGQWTRLAVAVASSLAFLLVLVVVAKASGIGMGDVKLLSVLSLPVAWANPSSVLTLLLMSFLAHGALAAALLLTRRTTRRAHLPMAPAIAVGLSVALATI